MEERRKFQRVNYDANAVVVVCDTEQKIFGDVLNVSPTGIALLIPEENEGIIGKDVIIVAETMIMYADAVRKEYKPDGKILVGFSARKFTPDVLQYLFNQITAERD